MLQTVHDLPSETLRDIVQDAHLNFLIGAGASAEFFSCLGDIESILTDLDAAGSSGDPAVAVARASVYAEYFSSVIEPNLVLLEHATASASIRETYAIFMETLNGILIRRKSSILNKEVNVFTTNVDLATEDAAETAGIHLNDGFTGRFKPRFSTTNFGSVLSRRSLQYDNLSEVPTVNLYKLHGSIGWATDQARQESIISDAELANVQQARVKLDAVIAGLQPLHRKSTAAELISKAAAAPKVDAEALRMFMESYEQLPVVNPTKQKFQLTVLNQNYYDLLRVFTNELEKENSVLFLLGFSCRDEHIRELLVRASRSNPTLQILIFCYKPQTATDIGELFDAHAIPNGNIRLVAPLAAEDPADQESFTLRRVTERFFQPIIPNRPRRPDATVDIKVALQQPLVGTND